MIKLSTRGRYGARALLELAKNYDSGLLSTQEISTRQGIPIKYLEQIFIPLKKASIIQSTRGPTGGYRLAMPPQELTLLRAVEVLEGSISFVGCTKDDSLCDRNEECIFHSVWKGLSDKAEEFLAQKTFAELAENDLNR